MNNIIEEIRKRTEKAESEGFDVEQFDDLDTLLDMVTNLQQENAILRGGIRPKRKALSPIIAAMQQENAALKAERDELKKAFEMACTELGAKLPYPYSAQSVEKFKKYFIDKAKEKIGNE